MTWIVVHYDEIGLKGKNRKCFEELLIRNIENKLGNWVSSSARESGQIVLEVSDDANCKTVGEIVSKIPGIAFFSFAEKVELDLEAIKEKALDMIKDKDYETFKIAAKRSDKGFPHTSMDINCALGDAVVEKFNKKAKMKDPDLTVVVNVSNKFAYLSCERIDGVGGLPTDKKQKVVALLSGGMDSPVAAYMMMKRGCTVILVHFSNKNQEQCSVKNKIVELTKKLSKFQQSTKLYMVPFENLQKEIIANVRAEQRMLIYRRFMMRIASDIAKREKARFLVLGDSLSQVASQTLENLEATYDGIPKAIFTPLIGLHKTEIMAIARKIGTFDISAQPYGDCCSYFLPKHPELHASKKMLRIDEEKFDMEKLIEDAVEKAELVEY